MNTLILVKDLHYTYPKTDAEVIKGISFQVAPGQIFGFLGPSGSGKSTTQKILIGLLQDYSGQVLIKGKSMKDWGKQLYEEIGVSFEYPTHYLKLSGRENLDLIGRLYKKNTLPIDDLLQEVNLLADGDKPVSSYSKGMKMRLNFAKAILHQPRLLFLDEPTSGLDPANARLIKDAILRLRHQGTTIIITTHNMNVADELCDLVGFLVDGQLMTIGQPKRLKTEYSSGQVSLDYEEANHLVRRDFPLEAIGSNQEFLELLKSKTIRELSTNQASLEEVFLKVTGRKLL